MLLNTKKSLRLFFSSYSKTPQKDLCVCECGGDLSFILSPPHPSLFVSPFKSSSSWRPPSCPITAYNSRWHHHQQCDRLPCCWRPLQYTTNCGQQQPHNVACGNPNNPDLVAQKLLHHPKHPQVLAQKIDLLLYLVSCLPYSPISESQNICWVQGLNKAIMYAWK